MKKPLDLELALIVSDIDGTLIDRAKVIPAFTLSELERVRREYGVALVLASSRMPTSIQKMGDSASAHDAFVAYDGGLVLSQGQELQNVGIVPEAATAVLNASLGESVYVGLFESSSWLVREIDYWALREARGTRVWPEVADLSGALAGWLAEGLSPHKIMARGEPASIDRIYQVARGLAEVVSVSRNRDNLVEIGSRQTDKYQGLKLILDDLSVSPEDVIAFGDGQNDLELLSHCGCGVAVANACGELLHVADDVTLANTEDGVGFSLRKYFPPKEGA